MKRIIAVVLLLLVLAIPVSAQGTDVSLTQTYTSADGSVSFDYPTGWIVQPLPQSSTIRLANSEDAFFSFRGQPDQVLIDLTVDAIGNFSVPPGAEPATTPHELIAAQRELFASLDAFDVTEVQDFMLGTQPGATYALGGNFTIAYYAITISGDMTASLMLSSAPELFEQWAGIAFAIVQTIHLQPASTPEPGAAPDDGALPLSETYTAPDDSFAFDYPAGWQIAVMPSMLDGTLPITVLASSAAALSKRPDSGLQPDEVQVQIIAGDKTLLLSPMLQATFNDTPAEMLTNYFALSPMPVHIDVKELSVCDHAAAQVAQAMLDLYSTLQIIDFGDGNAVLFAASVSADAADQWQPTLQTIAASVRFDPLSSPCTPD